MTTDLSQHLSQMPADELRPIVSQILDTEASPIAPGRSAEIGRSAGTATAGLFILAGSASTASGVGLVCSGQGLGSAETQLRQVRCRCRGARAGRLSLRRLTSKRMASVTPAASQSVRGKICTSSGWRICRMLHNRLGSLSTLSKLRRHAGQFNGRWSGPALPDWEWLSPVTLRTHYLTPRHTRIFATLPAMQRDPVVGRALPTDVIRDLVAALARQQ